MRNQLRSVPLILFAIAAACGTDDPIAPCCTTGDPALRIVNAHTTPVDVLVDGELAIQALGPGRIDTAAAALGAHQVVLRPVGAGATVPHAFTSSATGLSTVAAVRTAAGGVSLRVLDDTGSVVPPDRTKLRVLHLAPNAGTLQVYRTQPDYQQPVSWQFPFEYQPNPTPESAPFYQSTVGLWDVRIWSAPADTSGWDAAPVRVMLNLQGGEKATILILDGPAGGVRTAIL